MSPVNTALEMIIPLFATLSSFVLIGFIVWLLNRTRRERMMRMAELQTRMLEKFTSSNEFAAFIKTEEGQRYLRGMTEVPRKNPKQRIVNTIRTAVVLVVFGTGLLAIAFFGGFETPMDEPPFIIGFLAMVLGVGFLISAVVSYFMSKAWGLFPEEPKSISSEP